MDIRTWQEAGVRAGAYSARHRARSPFSPLRPTPIAIGSLSTAAIAAFAFVAPGILHSPAGSASTVLDGAPNPMAPLSPGGGGNAAPGYVSVTSPTTSATSDSPAAPSSTATSPAAAPMSSTSPSPFTERTPTMSSSTPRPSQPLPSRSQPPPTGPTSPSQPPTTPPTAPTTPVPTTPTTPPTTQSSTAPFNASAAVASALGEISAARSQQGVDLLSTDSLLTKAAKVHSTDMAHTGDFSHIGSDGSDPFSRASDLGCYSLSQELIAHGKPGDDVIGALMRDSSSRRALLSFWNSSIGVSAQLDPATGDVYWSIELGWG
ncbi:uncharacterized protein YkwD [Catenulispora sp. EB89]|uniref:CAP domain-containing protein n=1 Tax=Catenulispora sp. EB89 TaxID=3156257 RepID=UPI003511467D